MRIEESHDFHSMERNGIVALGQENNKIDVRFWVTQNICEDDVRSAEESKEENQQQFY